MNDGKSTVASEAGGLTVGTVVGGGLSNAAFRRNIVDAGTNAGGGGMHVGGSFLGSIEADGRDTHFDANHAGVDGGGMYVARDFRSTDKRARIYANYFATSTASRDGGGLYIKGDLDGGVHGSPVTGKIAGVSGGGIYARSISNGIHSDSYFNDN